MTHTGVVSVASWRSARRNRSFFSTSVISGSVGAVQALAEHHAEAALDLRIACLFEGGECVVAFQELLALERSLAALHARLAIQRPSAQQILLQRDLDIARRLGGGGHGLQVKAHGCRVRGR